MKNLLQGWSLRVADEDDLEQVAAIEKKTQPFAPWSESSFYNELEIPYGTFWVLTDDETDAQVAGFIILHVIDGHAHLVTLSVAPEHRRKGFAEYLVRQAHREVSRQGAQVMSLEVRTRNEAAVKLYEKLGYTIRRIMPKYYSNGDDAYVMEIAIEEDGVRF